MTAREKILASLRGCGGEVVWAPRWDLWYEAARRNGRMPEKCQNWHIYDVARAWGMAIKGYGVRLYELENNVPRRGFVHGDTIAYEYETPFGPLLKVERITAELATAGVRGRTIKEFISSEGDYDPALYVLERTQVLPRHEALEHELRLIGVDGVLLAFAGHAPAHEVMREWTGYEGFYYQLQDNAARLEKVIQAVERVCEDILRVAVESPAEVVEFDGNYDAQLTPLPIYRRFFLPWHRRFTEACHAVSKLVATHADGHNDGLLGPIQESGFDVAEAFTPPPMTNIGVGQALRAWNNRMSIWGGLAAIAFTPQFSEEEFEYHVLRTLDKAGGQRFVLATGDNVPTDGLLHRIQKVAHIVASWNQQHVGGSALCRGG